MTTFKKFLWEENYKQLKFPALYKALANLLNTCQLIYDPNNLTL